MLVQTELQDHADLPFGDPLRARRLDGGPGEAAIAVELAPLHREADRRAVRIAEYDLKFRPEHGVQELRKDVAVGRIAGRADRHLAAHRVLDRTDPARA